VIFLLLLLIAEVLLVRKKKEIENNEPSHLSGPVSSSVYKNSTQETRATLLETCQLVIGSRDSNHAVELLPGLFIVHSKKHCSS
jgi:hypothetical protein